MAKQRPTPTPLVKSRLNEERALGELYPTIEVAKAYLLHRHSGTWGKLFYIPESIQEAAELITQTVDAVNAIRNLALDSRDLQEAALRYEQVAFPVNTKHLLRGNDVD